MASVEGILIDRLGIRNSITMGVLLVSFSAFLRSFAFDFATLFGSVAVFGVGGPMLSIGLPKLIVAWFSGEERGVAAGIYTTGAASGGSFALAVTNSIVFPQTGSWQGTFRLYALATVIVAIIWWIMWRDTPVVVQKDGEDKKLSTTQILSEIVKYKDVWLIVIMRFAIFVCRHGLISWLPRMLELHGLARAGAGFLASIPPIAGIVRSILITTLAGRLKSRKPLILLLFAACGASILLMELTSDLPLVASLVTYGSLSGAMLSLMMLVLMNMRNVGEKRMGAAGGLYYTIAEMGGFVGPSIIGYLKDLTGTFLAGMVTLSILCETMIVPVLILNEQAGPARVSKVCAKM